MDKLKAGDKVICVNNQHYENEFVIGQVYIIQWADRYNSMVKVDGEHTFRTRWKLVTKYKHKNKPMREP